MADESNNKEWIAELERALNEDCDQPDDYELPVVINDAIRPIVWKTYLCNYPNETNTVFNEIFDLPEQQEIRQDCLQYVSKLGNDEDEKVSVLSDLETILTHHRKLTNIPYSSNNGWLELLQPLVPLKLPRSETYYLFRSIITKFIPCKSSVYSLFQLLILYHDPNLCSFLDTKKIATQDYAMSWSLFACNCSLPVVTAIWDLYFQQADPFFLLFLGLVILLNSSVQILELKEQSKDKIIGLLQNLPSQIQENDIQDLCLLAQYYCVQTPGSFRQDLENQLFDVDFSERNTTNNSPSNNGSQSNVEISQALVLPVSVRELVENISLPPEGENAVRFFLVDCRPADHYNSGHLPTAFHLDPSLMLQGGEVYSTAVQGLLSAQRQALQVNSHAGGEHLCFMGCGGTLESDQYTHMIVSSFLRTNTYYVTLLSGGYNALHNYFEDSLDETLVDHIAASCLVCIKNKSGSPTNNNIQKNGTQSPSRDIFGKIGAAMKLKSAEVKGKLLEYIVNPGGNITERHVSPNDNKRKRYRNVAPVFAIDDDQEPQAFESDKEEPSEDSYEIVKVSDWTKTADIIGTFECREIKMNGEMFSSTLMISETHIYVLRGFNKKGFAKVTIKRPLTSIARITKKKKDPEYITLKYGVTQGEELVCSDLDRFYIPKYNEATSMISTQVLKLTKPKEESTSRNFN